MAFFTQVRVSRTFTTAQAASFIPDVDEIVMDSETRLVYVGDGSSAVTSLNAVGGNSQAPGVPGDVWINSLGVAASADYLKVLQPDSGEYTTVLLTQQQALKSEDITDITSYTPGFAYAMTRINDSAGTLGIAAPFEPPDELQPFPLAKIIRVHNRHASAALSLNSVHSSIALASGITLPVTIAAGGRRRFILEAHYISGAWQYDLF